MTPAGENSLPQRWTRRLWQDPERKESLYFALPYLGFFLIPIARVFSDPSSWKAWVALPVALALATTYVLSWLINPVAPRQRIFDRRLFVTLTVLTVLWLALVALGDQQSMWNILFFSFVLSPAVFQLPERLILPFISLLIMLIVAAGIIVGASMTIITISVLAVVGGTIVLWVSRWSIEKQRRCNIRVAQENQQQVEALRNQLASNLHDVLGQDLTALTVKAQLVERLLEREEFARAREHVRDIAAMSHQALDDVRQVVLASRSWSLKEELESALAILRASGIDVHVQQDEDIYLDQPAQAYARVLREATTNMINHSAATECWISICPKSMIVTNNGYNPEMSKRTAGSKTGLIGLTESVRGIGGLTWGPTEVPARLSPGSGEQMWELRLELQ